MKFGLRNIRRLVAAAGHPERAFPSIHVAGTNGKGSTAAFLASIFREAGCRVGLYTSPHLVRFTERIRINGVEMPEERLVAYARLLRPAIEECGATFFEATTCIAFCYFADEGVDIGVIETGLGGRLDATNVLTPLVSVVTNIAMEHTEYLGATIGAITREKGGIIKKGIPVVTGSRDARALSVLRRIAFRRGSHLHRAAMLVDIVRRKDDDRAVRVSTSGMKIPRCVPGLPGNYQLENASLAVATVEVLRRSPAMMRMFPGLNAAAVRRGLARVRRHTGLQGRMQEIARGTRFLMDVAHNPHAMEALVGEIRAMKRPPRAAVFGVMKDKDYGPMIDMLGSVVPEIIAVAPRMKRALPARELVRAGLQRGARIRLGGRVARGVAIALKTAGSGPILITGSHYVVGEALHAVFGESA